MALLYAQTGHLDIFLLAESVDGSFPVLVAFGLMTGGLLIKAALLPFHFWLPPAHAGAPAPVSAILSGMVTKASLASGQWWWAVVIALGGLLTAAYVFKILSFTFVPVGGRDADAAPATDQGAGQNAAKDAGEHQDSNNSGVPELRPVPAVMTLAALALAVLCVLFGFRAEEVITLLLRDMGLEPSFDAALSTYSVGGGP